MIVNAYTPRPARTILVVASAISRRDCVVLQGDAHGRNGDVGDGAMMRLDPVRRRRDRGRGSRRGDLAVARRRGRRRRRRLDGGMAGFRRRSDRGGEAVHATVGVGMAIVVGRGAWQRLHPFVEGHSPRGSRKWSIMGESEI